MTLKKAARKIYFWILAVTLLPLVYASFSVLLQMTPHLVREGWQVWWLYGAGILAYGLTEILFKKPMWIYVVGHEMTHAISGILSGARVHHFRASSRGGEVRLSKSNFLIALSPYIIPFYSLLVIGVYAIASHWVKNPYLVYGFQFLVGATLAFHVSLTYHAIHKRQPDLKILGLFLSMTIIALGNAVVIAMFCVALFKNTPTLKEYLFVLKDEAVMAFSISGQYLMMGISKIIDYMGKTK